MKVLKLGETYFRRVGNKYEEFKVERIDFVRTEDNAALYIYNGNGDLTSDGEHRDIYSFVDNKFEQAHLEDNGYSPSISDNIKKQGRWINDEVLGCVRLTNYPYATKAYCSIDSPKWKSYEWCIQYNGENYRRDDIRTYLTRPHAEESVSPIIRHINGECETLPCINDLMRLEDDQKALLKEYDDLLRKMDKEGIRLIRDNEDCSMYAINARRLDVTQDEYDPCYDEDKYVILGCNVSPLQLERVCLDEHTITYDYQGVFVKRK